MSPPLLAALLICCCLFHSSTSQDVFFSMFASNSSTLTTIQAASIVDEAMQLSMVNASVMRNQEFDAECYIQRAQAQLAAEVGSNSIALIDGSCSRVAENLSKNKNETLMVIFASTSAAINNGTVTMDTYRTIPSDRGIPPSLVPLMEQYGWQQLSLVTATGSQYTELKRLIATQLSDDNDDMNTLLEIDVSDNNINDSIKTLLDSQPHIYFLNTDIQTGLHFLCQGFTQSHYYPNYLWILPGWWYQVGVSSQWWDDATLLTGTACSSMSDVLTVLNMSLIMRTIPVDESNIEDDEALVFDTSNISMVDYSTSSYAVDAVLSLMVALNETHSPSTPAYNELSLAFKNVKFYGASGYVSYNENGDRANTQVLVQQFVYNQEKSNSVSVMDIATIQNGLNFSYLNTSVDEVFPDGSPPDGTPIEIINVVRLGVTIFIVILCAIGLTLALACLVFNIIFREKKIVKLTSPNLNYFLMAGVLSLLFGMIFYIIGTQDIGLLLPICTLRRILVSIGHDIGFTVALVKTWRIHYIFRNPSPNKRAPKDWQLFMIAFLIVSIDIAVSVLLFIPDNIWNDVGFVPDRERSSSINDQGVAIEYYVPTCGGTPFYYVWIFFTTIFKLILHVIAIVLSFRIRNIKVDTLNDFKYTSIIVYTSTVLIVILIGVLVAAVNYIDVYAVMVPLLVFLEVLVFLLFSFVPKMVALHKDPRGDHVFDKPTKKQVSVLGDSLKRNVSLSYYNRKESTVKDEDSGRCTLDSKDQKYISQKEYSGNKDDDNVFIENRAPPIKNKQLQCDQGDSGDSGDNTIVPDSIVVVNGNNSSKLPCKESDV